MAKIQGTWDPAFVGVADLLAEHVKSGLEHGASISVWHGSENLVDIWGGYADAARSKPWSKDTVANIWSSTKTITALAVLMCHDRGLLSVHDPVAKYWPEFAANGKEKVLIKHIMSHSSGVAGWEEPITPAQMYDVKFATERLATQALWWEPGTASGYHAQNMGHLLGEVVRRVSGKSFTEFVRTEIAEPLNADIQIGALEKDWPRVAQMTPPPPRDRILEPGSLAFKVFTNPAIDAENSNTEAWRRAEMGALNGHSNAAALAKVLSVISNRGRTVDNKQFLKEETVDMIFQTQVEGVDLILGGTVRFGIGFGINTGGASQGSVPFVPKGKVAFWGGYGGSINVLDTDHNVTVSYVMNKMGPGTLGNERSVAHVVKVYAALKKKGIIKGDASLVASVA
jgi:CubicO group peptidase (beta-lactamase class C family)